MKRKELLAACMGLIALGSATAALEAMALQDAATGQVADPPRPASSLTAEDHPLDGGNQIDLRWNLSPDDSYVSAKARKEGAVKAVPHYVVQKSGKGATGPFEDVSRIAPDIWDYQRGSMKLTIEVERGEPYWFRVAAAGPGTSKSEFIQTTEATVAQREWFDGGRGWLALITVVLCGSVVTYIAAARRGMDLKVRKIAGLEAVDEAVGRATEMGRSVLFIPGIQDMNDIQTVAGITILARVARTAAEYDAKVEVPTSRSLVMTTARETVQAAFLAAGRPDAYNEDNIYYVTDEQFGYVAYLSGMMVREKPAACFYMGSFFAESLILAETGNSIGAIQVAGTAQPAQLPFFVAACDYTLIGEEFFAASAYLSGEPEQLGSLKGQDVGKLIVAAGLLIGCCFATLASIVFMTSGNEANVFAAWARFLTDTILQ